MMFYFSYKATGSFYKWELYYTVIATDEETGFKEKAKGLNKNKAIAEAINLILKKVTGESHSHYAGCMLMYPHLNTFAKPLIGALASYPAYIAVSWHCAS